MSVWSLQDKILDVQIVELDEGTKARNRAFQERLDEIWRSTNGFEAKLRTEAKEAVETILNMKDQYQMHIDNFNNSLQAEINAIFDKVDLEIIPSEISRVDVIDANLDEFIKKTVPAAIERQSGEVPTKHLKSRKRKNEKGNTSPSTSFEQY